MDENRYQSGEEPRIGDVLEHLDGTSFGTYDPSSLKLIERADPGCPYKIGDTLSHAGSKRTGVVQEFKRYVHPTTKEVRYSAWVDVKNSARRRLWELDLCKLATPAEQPEQPEQYPYYVVNAEDKPWLWGVLPTELTRKQYVIRVLGPQTTEYLFENGKTRHVLRDNLNLEHYLSKGSWKRVNTNPFDTGSCEGHTLIGVDFAKEPSKSVLIGVRSDTGEVVRASDLKREPASFTECESCRAKPGSPQLCDGCLYRRAQNAYNELWEKYVEVSKERNEAKQFAEKYNALKEERTKLAANWQTRHDELKQQLDTVTRDRDAVLDRNKTQMESIRRIRGERDEATQAADKLQTQLNECRDSLANHIREVKEVRRERDTLKEMNQNQRRTIRQHQEFAETLRKLVNNE